MQDLNTFKDARAYFAPIKDKLSNWELNFVFDGSWDGRMSEKQKDVVLRIVKNLQAADNKVDVSKLFDLVDKALAKGAKRIAFKVGGDKLKYDARYDSFSVFRGDYPYSLLFLTVKRDGTVVQRRSCPDLFVQVLELAENPLAFAIQYGRLQGCCMFCSKALDTKESVGAGYGPVCADKFGLPWGDTTKYEEMRQSLIA